MLRNSAIALIALVATTAAAQEDSVSTLIQNARIFDGVSEALIDGQDVLVTDGVIAQVAPDIAAPDGASVIDADGRVMTPGLIYMHEHLMMQMSSPMIVTRLWLAARSQVTT